jgi:hypothetical protein
MILCDGIDQLSLLLRVFFDSVPFSGSLHKGIFLFLSFFKSSFVFIQKVVFDCL